MLPRWCDLLTVRHTVICATAVVVASGFTYRSASGVGHWYDPNLPFNDRYYQNSPNFDGSVPPPDLVAPTDHLLSDKGSFISPRWILAAHHISGNVGPADDPNPNVTVHSLSIRVPNALNPQASTPGFTLVDFDVVDAVSRENPVLGTDRDIRLLKLADVGHDASGQLYSLDQVNQGFFRLSSEYRVDNIITFGGFGQIYTGPGFTSPIGGGGTVHWGKNLIAAVDGALLGQTEPAHLIFADTPPGSPGHVNYEGVVLSGDSGSGVFNRNGWHWELLAANVGRSTSTSAALQIDKNLQWIIDNVDDVDLSSPLPQLPIPVADTIWNGIGGYEWNTASLWSGGVPTAHSTSWLQGDIAISSQASHALARDLFVGANGYDSTVSISGTLDVSGDLFIAPEGSDVGGVTMSGGVLRANNMYSGVYGNGQVTQLGGVLDVYDAMYIGKNNGITASTFQMALDASATVRQLIIGESANAIGKVEIFAAGNPSLTTHRTEIGRYGSGEMIQAGGHHATNALIIANETGSTGTYELSGGVLESTQVTVGVNGIGLFSQSGGTLLAESVKVQAGSTFGMEGGVISSEHIEVSGTLRVTGGILDTANLQQFMATGTIDFDGSGATLQVARITDLSTATLINSQGAVLDIQAGSLLVVDPQTKSLIDSGQLIVTTAGQSVHQYGSTLIVDRHTVRGTGEIDDFTVVTTFGSDAGVLQADSGPIHLNGGLVKTEGAYVNLGSTGQVRVTKGRATGEPISIIQAQPGEFFARSIFVEPTGKLHLSGTGIVLSSAPSSELINEGSLEIGLGVEHVALHRPDGGLGVFEQRGNAETVFDIASSTSDRLIVDQAYLFDGDIKVNVPSATLAQLSIGDEFQVIDAVTFGFGEFARTVYGQSGFEDFKSQDMLLAVLYDDQQFLGDSRTFSGVTVRASFPADFNLDGRVDGLDLAILSENFNLQGTWTEGDANGDGQVNGLDLAILNEYFNQSAPASIPEPSAALLAAVALLSLSAARRR